MAVDIAWKPVERTAESTNSRPSIDVVECIVAAAIFAIAAFAFQRFLDNTTIATTNGLWKSVDVANWRRDPSWSRVDFSNFLYFPVQALFCRGLDAAGIYVGQTWRQIALLNPLFGALGAGASYLFVRRWTSSRFIAAASVIFYCGCGFYMLLSLISEDDMPNSVLILVTTLLACAYFARPTFVRLMTVALVFSVAWLWEWRVLFPSLPPLLLAAFLAPGKWWQRLLRPAFFLGSTAILPAVITIFYVLQKKDADVIGAKNFFIQLFWTGKGVGTGWAGWSSDKLLLFWNGLFDSVLGGRNLGFGPSLWTWQNKLEALGGTFILVVLAIFGVIYAWRHRRETAVFISVVLLAGTFGAGTVFNLYSQPQDPQMVINVMIWTLPAGAIVLHRLLRTPKMGLAQSNVRRGVALALAAIPLCYNAVALSQYRGEDTAAIKTIDRLNAKFDPKTTVYLYHGFDGIVTWHVVLEGGALDRTDELPSVSSAKRDFKGISVTTIPIVHPRWTATELAEAWKSQVERAIDKGYKIVAAPTMVAPTPLWHASFMTFAKPEVADAFRDIFNKTFELREVYRDPAAGIYYSVEHRRP